MGLGIDPKNDYVFRLAFGDPANSDLLIHLLNAILELSSPIVEVEILNPFVEQEFETDKLAILDIKARDSDGRLLNVEMQKSVTTALRERLVYYAACLCSGQLFQGDEYVDLCPTIGICILASLMFPQVKAGHLTFSLCNLQHGIPFTDHFQIHTVELPKYNAGAADCPVGASLEKWAWLFQRAEELDAEQLRILLPEAPYQKMIGILEMISKTPNQRHIHDSLQRAARDRAWELQSARRAAREEGLAEGLAEGQQIGREIGREEGREIGLELGREEGVAIGQIQLLEQLLNDRPTDDKFLAGMTLVELNERLSMLKDRLKRRDNL